MKVSVNIEGLNAAQAMRVTSLLEDLEHDTQLPVAAYKANSTTEAAPAAPVPQLPVATTTEAASTDDSLALEPTEGAELDKDGVPWDSRIHAKTKSKTAKGLWKKLKGGDHDLYEKLTAAYRANSTATPPMPQPPAAATEIPAAPVPQPPAAPAETVTPPVPKPPVTVTEAAPAEDGDLTIPPFLDRRNGQDEATETTPVEGLIQTAQACDCRTDIGHEQMMSQVNVALADPNNPVSPVDLPKITSAFNLQTLVDCANDPVTIGKIYHVLGGQ